MIGVLRGNFERAFGLYRDLVVSLSPETLGEKLPGIRSNTVALQLWCVVGARESYTRGIRSGEWAGFECSLQADHLRSPQSIGAALEGSAEELLRALDDFPEFTTAQQQLTLDLLEHELAHQGQLIRYLYGLGLEIPESWKKRFALS